MSLSLDFEPHSYYMGFAIQKDQEPYSVNEKPRAIWRAYADNGNTYRVDEVAAYSLPLLKRRIRDYHLREHNGYGERIAKRRLEYLRGELRKGTMSYGEQAELQGLIPYIEGGDVELLEAAGAPEFEEQ